ncbi:unnamed protein product [Agarophyton chilense]
MQILFGSLKEHVRRPVLVHPSFISMANIGLGANSNGLNGSMVPSFQHLLNHIENRTEQPVSLKPSSWDVKIEETADHVFGSPVSNISPSCSSTTSVRADSFEPISGQDSNVCSSRQDFWTIVLGPSQSLPPEKPESKIQPSGSLQKPHACSSCPLRFKKRCNLQSHVRSVHEKLRPFSCGVCLRRFGRKSNCAKHMRLVHRLRDSEVRVLPAKVALDIKQ